MSLLEQAFEDFKIVNKSVVDDGLGGTTTQWTEGATIKGAIVFNSAPETQVAQALGSTNLYQFIVRRENNLDYHDVVKRVEDGKIFRITNNADENKTPNTANLNMKVYTAEEWVLS